MAQAIFHTSYETHCNAAISGDTDDLSIRCLTAILTSLLDDPGALCLPAWSYRTWCLALQYRDLNTRAQAPMQRLGRKRDRALSHPAVRAAG